MITIQNTKFPSLEKCNEDKMYFNGMNYFIRKNKVKLMDEGYISTDTYFNSLSIGKWSKYTKIEKFSLEIEVSGKCEIYVCFAYIDKDNIVRRRGNNIAACLNEVRGRKKYTLDYQFEDEDVIAYFIVKALEDNVFIHSSKYISNNEIKINEINIAIGICTYKREEYVYRNITEIKERLIDNILSPVHGHLQVIISDNGHSLEKSKASGENILIVENPNYGGSAGFTRCIIETLKKKDKENITHIILMDDDILLDCDAIERTYIFLTMLKEEYQNSMIGGGMLVLSERNRQFESAALYYHGNLSFTQKNADLRTIRNVIQNEMERDINYNAWCYCCMPLTRISFQNLPLPFFIHMDDVEFGVRNKFDIITLNGISVWHPFFTNQRGTHIVYYDVRNKLITMAEFGGIDIRNYALRYLEMFYRSIFNYDYERTIMACRGIKDFCKGIDYFKTIHPLELNNELVQVNKKWVNATDNIRQAVKKATPETISVKTLLRTYCCISKNKRTVYACDISDAYPHGAKEIVIYNNITDKYCIYKKSFIKMLQAKMACREAKKLIKKVILNVNFEWKDRIHELQNLEFWEKYLNLG